jgi:hypothetical protein
MQKLLSDEPGNLWVGGFPRPQSRNATSSVKMVVDYNERICSRPTRVKMKVSVRKMILPM